VKNFLTCKIKKKWELGLGIVYYCDLLSTSECTKKNEMKKKVYVFTKNKKKKQKNRK